jgi:hypothetical protein
LPDTGCLCLARKKSRVFRIGHADDVVGTNLKLQRVATDMKNYAVIKFLRRIRRNLCGQLDCGGNWNQGENEPWMEKPVLADAGHWKSKYLCKGIGVNGFRVAV